jgi:hypothetical protein
MANHDAQPSRQAANRSITQNMISEVTSSLWPTKLIPIGQIQCSVTQCCDFAEKMAILQLPGHGTLIGDEIARDKFPMSSGWLLCQW